MKIISALQKMFEDGTVARNAESSEKEKLKLGTARAGSSGAITEDGKHLYTQCGRLAQARMLGYERAPSQSLLAMFEGGLSLENFIEKNLLAIGAEFKKEEPVKGNIGGIPVSGRPDFDILIDGEYIGMEVKSMASPFSAIKQVKNRFPLVKHLVQACTYLMLLDRDKWIVAVGNIFFANERGFKVDPGLRLYMVRVQNSGFIVQNEHEEEMPLPFSRTDIERYYSVLTSASNNRTLMERPTELELNMDSYDRCKYCPMSSACNEIEAGQIGFEQWLKRVKE